MRRRSTTENDGPQVSSGHSNFESLDYGFCDSTVFRAYEALKSPADPLVYRGVKFGICTLLGLSIAFTAFGVNFGVENVSGTKFWLAFQAAKHSYVMAWIALCSVQTALCLMAVCCCVYISPAAEGSGIPEVIAYLNGVDVPGTFLFRTLIAKILGSLGSVGGGLAIGKEGPFVHIGAAFASLLSQVRHQDLDSCVGSVPGGAATGITTPAWHSATGMQGGTWDHHPNLKWLKRFKNDSERRNFVTCGAAAGVAAAFRAPVGGLLFALEQLSSSWSEQLLLTCFFTTAIVSITIRMIMRICNQGGCGFFGEGDAIIFHIAEQDAQVRTPHRQSLHIVNAQARAGLPPSTDVAINLIPAHAPVGCVCLSNGPIGVVCLLCGCSVRNRGYTLACVKVLF